MDRLKTQNRCGTNLAVRRRFYSPCERKRHWNLSSHAAVKLGIRPIADAPLKLSDGTGDKGSKVHYEIQDTPSQDIVNSQRLYSLSGLGTQSVFMTTDVWPQRKNFRKRLDAYLKKNDLIQADVAKMLGIELSHLRNALYRPEKRLSLEVLQVACRVFGCHITEFIDNPNESLPGIDDGEMAHLSPSKRLIIRSVAQKLGQEDVTDESAEKVWKAIDSLIDAGKIRSPR